MLTMILRYGIIMEQKLNSTGLEFCVFKFKGEHISVKKIKKHIILDIILMWLLIFAGIYIGIKNSPILIFYSVILSIWYIYRTYRYCLIFMDVLFSEPRCVLTRGYRFAVSERVYALDLTKNIHYYYVLFDDKTLNDGRFKDKYIFFEARPFRGGDLLQVTYYKRSKFILDIQKIN